MLRSFLCINSPVDVQRLVKILAPVPCRHCGVTDYSWGEAKGIQSTCRPATPVRQCRENEQGQKAAKEVTDDTSLLHLYPGSAINSDSFPPGDPARAVI